jgi:ketosteroid isomerase-like protein
MRQQFCLSLLAAVSLPVFAASPTEVINEFHAALVAGDTAKAVSLLSPTVEIYESGHVERSRDEYAGHHLPADIAFTKSVTRTVSRSSERIAGDLAVVMQETDTQGTHKGMAVHLIGAETAVLVKKGKDWVITHFHWSSRKTK